MRGKRSSLLSIFLRQLEERKKVDIKGAWAQSVHVVTLPWTPKELSSLRVSSDQTKQNVI